MLTKFSTTILGCVITAFFVFSLLSSCQKESSTKDLSSSLNAKKDKAPTPAQPNFNLEVILRGAESGFGHVKFRQANDAAKIVSLDVWVRDLLPNHQYLLQRAADTNLDGNCTSTSWLTLGNGLQPQAITTDANGTGTEGLWRDLAALTSGATFDIHFQIIDAVTKTVVLTNDCYQYTVR
jgi:hypothetical protein